jgi:hypothetical protein
MIHDGQSPVPLADEKTCSICGEALSETGGCDECQRAHRVRLGLMFFLVLPFVGAGMLFFVAPMGMPGSDLVGALGGGLLCLGPIIGLICNFAPPPPRSE